MAPAIQLSERLYTVADLAAVFNVCSDTIYRWAKVGKIPGPDVRLNARVLRWRHVTVKHLLGA